MIFYKYIYVYMIYFVVKSVDYNIIIDENCELGW